MFDIKIDTQESWKQASLELARGRRTAVLAMLLSHLTEEEDKIKKRRLCKLTLQKAKAWGVTLPGVFEKQVSKALVDLV